jgi:uncharacterized protein (DUF697 family)
VIIPKLEHVMSTQEQIENTDIVEAALTTPQAERATKVAKLIKRYAMVSAGLGFIPVPVLDVAAISGVQYTMIRDIAGNYGFEFSKERARVIVSSILGGSLPTVLAAAGGGSLVKSIPFVGTIAGAVFVPALASAVTIAMGRVFSQHFEAGGTLLDFDADKLRSHFKTEFEAAKFE